MALPIPPPYSQSIPNSPFYSPPTYITKGAYYPLTVGSGLIVDPVTAIISSTGGGGGGVVGVYAGAGIAVSGNVGNVTVTNTGVTSVVAGSGISVSSGAGNVTISALYGGTVTSISTGAGLTGGPITSAGTIAIANTGVTATTYTNPTITVNAQGQIVSATSSTALQTLSATLPISVTSGVNPVISIADATTLDKGAVLLSDSVTSTSSSTAATSLAVKTAYDAAILAIPKSCITGKGALISGVAASTPVALPVGVDGQFLTACSATASGLCWLTFTPTNGTVTSITAGTGLSGGTITTSGTIALDNTAVVPGSYTNASLTVDAQGRLTAASNGPAAIPCSVLTAKGDLITTVTPNTPVALPVGTNGQILVACSACTEGMYWASTTLPPFGSPNYGSFLNTGTQTITTVNIPQAVTLNSTVASNGFSLVGGSQITATSAGIYNLQFSIQLVVTTGGGGSVEIWLAKNGTAVPNSNTRFAVKNVNEAEFAALNFVESLAAGEYLELIWVTDDIHIQLISYAAGANFAGAPAIPSAIVTVVPVGA